jgi:hypothetical protein
MKYLLVVIFLAQFDFFSGTAWGQQRGQDRMQGDQEESRMRKRPKRGHCKNKDKRKRRPSNSSENYYAPEYGKEEQQNYGRYSQEI